MMRHVTFAKPNITSETATFPALKFQMASFVTSRASASATCGSRSAAPATRGRTTRAVVAAPKAVMTLGSSVSHVSSSAALTAGRQTVARAARVARSSAARAEISYIMVKPDGVQRGLVGEIISRFEKKGFKMIGLKMFECPKELAEEHYKDLSSKPFFPDLVDYIISGPVVAMVWEGNGVVKSARKLIGATNPLESEPGTIRGDYAIEVGRNVIHGSDSPENGEREAALWFGGESFVEWTPANTPWLIEEGRE